MRHSSPGYLVLNICWACSLVVTAALAQAQVEEDAAIPVIQAPDIQAQQAAMEQQIKAAVEARRNAAGANPTKPAADTADENKNGEKKETEKKEGPLEHVKRSAEPPKPPDPSEFRAIPDEHGLVSFQFRNQPWPDVLRWYSDICNLSFDWQELPGDYINLATQRPHTLEETGDMINRALLMRGFTMLQDNETFTVVKTEGLNPSLVPRVNPAQLNSLPPHKYVRTSFSLNWLLAEEVHQEFASMISKNGKLTPLQSTNRLEAIDAAANLRDINDILEQEQSAIALENLAREFLLQHARAAAVKVQLEAFLGIKNPSSDGAVSGRSSSSSAQMQAQMQQMQQRMQQQMQQQMQQARGGNAVAGPAASRKRPDDVYLVANERSNSVIVHAPPNKMAIIESFIARVDVRNAASMDFQRLNTRMKVFRLASLGPTELVSTLTAMDVLEPSTRLQVDEDNNAIIAYASVADQYLIKSVIERLDGSERSFQVISLRRLDAESVAGSIKFLMGADEQENSSSSNRNRYYGYYDPYGSRNQDADKKKDKMRVGANVQDNQLLLWVNEIELEEVNNLLVKLGELPPAGGRRSTMRVIDASRQPETYEYLKRLKEQWDKVSPNQLIIPDASEFKPKDESPADESGQPKSEPQSPPKLRLDDDTITGTFHDTNAGMLLTSSPTDPDDKQASDGQLSSNLEKAQEAGGAPPVKIFLDEAGNIVLLSDDIAALDRLEEIMQANRPPLRPYDVFKVKHAPASWVAYNLEDYFDEKKDEQRPRFLSFFLDQNNQDEDRQLGDRPPLRFISDNDTNSIVVQGADDLDRKTIKELIELWDVPSPVDTDSIRFTRLVRIRYSRAESIVNTLKEAYRDLLSAGDKAFQQSKGGGNEENNKREDSGSTVQGGGLGFGGFNGKLSFGPDNVTNSILVVAEGQPLLDLMCEMIEKLDEAARPEGNVEVYKLGAGVKGKSLEKALRAIFQSTQQQQPQQPGNQQPQNNPNGQSPASPPNNFQFNGRAAGFQEAPR